jgi:hypothetical protein
MPLQLWSWLRYVGAGAGYDKWNGASARWFADGADQLAGGPAVVNVAAASADTLSAWSEPEAVAIGDDYTELLLPAGRYLKVGSHLQKCRSTVHTVRDTAVSSMTQRPLHCGLSEAAMHIKWPDLTSHEPPPLYGKRPWQCNACTRASASAAAAGAQFTVKLSA